MTYWLILDRILHAVLVQIENGTLTCNKHGQVSVLLSNYHLSCGYTPHVHNQLFNKSTLAERRTLHELGFIRFDSLGHGWSYARMILENTHQGSTHRSNVPLGLIRTCLLPEGEEGSGTSAEADVTAQRSLVPYTLPMQDRVKRMITADSPTTDAASTALVPSAHVRDECQKYMRQNVFQALQKVLVNIITHAESKRKNAGVFVVCALQKMVDYIWSSTGIAQPGQDASATNAIDASIVNSLISFLSIFTTRGTRTAEQSHSLQVVLMAIFAAGPSIATVKRRLCINMAKMVDRAISLRSELDRVVDQSDGLSPRSIELDHILGPKVRATRSDSVALDHIREYWHRVCRIDTFGRKRVQVSDSDGNISTCSTHIQSNTTEQIFNDYLQSPEYARWQQELYDTDTGKSPSVGLSLFKRGKCACIQTQGQRDCADEDDVGMQHLLQALARHRKNQAAACRSCTCAKHSRRDGYDTIHESVGTFLRYTLCPKIAFDSVTRPIGPPATRVNSTPEPAAKTRKISTPAAGYKRVNGVAAAPPDGQLRLQPWVCGHLQCKSCGIKKRLGGSCPVDEMNDALLKVRVFEDVPRASAAKRTQFKKGTTTSTKPRTQRELVEREISAAELWQRLVAAAKSFIPHHWDAVWDLHSRQLLLETFNDSTLVVMTDFSATYNCDPSFRLNSAIPAHAIQDVFIVSHSPRTHTLPNGAQRRIMDTDVWHAWGSPGLLANDNFYHTACLNRIVDHYTELLPQHLASVSISSDGCRSQYKCRKNCLAMVNLASKTGLTIEHRYAPRATFKTVADSAGNDAKSKMRALEESGVADSRGEDARGVWRALSLHMPAPKERNLDTCSLQSFTGRHQLFVTDIEDAHPTDASHPMVVVVDTKRGLFDCNPLPGIASIYCVRAEPAAASKCPTVSFRRHACSCAHCLSNSAPCLVPEVTGTWSKRTIKVRDNVSDSDSNSDSNSDSEDESSDDERSKATEGLYGVLCSLSDYYDSEYEQG